jgi:parvulin-like peptidyl-prolyl isomerase
VHILLPDSAKAFLVRKMIGPDNFLQLARQYSIDPVEDTANVHYVSSNDMVPEVGAVAFTIRIGGTTPCIRSQRGYYILRILDKQPPGSLRAMADVREEIINRLNARKQKIHAEELLEKLKNKTAVELRLEQIPGYSILSDTETNPKAADLPGDSVQ